MQVLKDNHKTLCTTKKENSQISMIPLLKKIHHQAIRLNLIKFYK